MNSLSDLPGAVGEILRSARAQTNERELPIPGENGSRNDGATRWLAIRHASIANGPDQDSIFILRDVSERKRLEAAEARLRRDQALAEMSTMLAHEIRNPLGSLELFAGLLAESPQDQECRQWVEHLQAGLRTLGATVNNVLHFHSLPEPQRVSLDLGQLLEWGHGFLAPLARQSRVTLSLQNRLRGFLFPCDRHRLEQVLLNLVLNGIRAMPEGGWIEISGRSLLKGDIEIAVADTGPGIPAEYLNRIFDPGFSTRPGSPGLGLTVCRKIVEQHGGSMAVANRPQGGLLVCLLFPDSVKERYSR